MANLFDRYQSNAFNAILSVMGSQAEWSKTPSQKLVSRVLLNSPTKTAKIFEMEFNPSACSIEYYEGEFQGLRELVDQGRDIILNVDGKDFGVKMVIASYDGKSLIAQIEEI